MTPTAIELWNDIFFILKRIDEQKQYCKDLLTRFITKKEFDRTRFDELHDSATQVRLRFEQRRNELWNPYNFSLE